MNWSQIYSAIHREYLKHDSLCLLYELGHIVGGLCAYGSYDSSMLWVDNDKKYVYFIIPKVATSSIKSAITGLEAKDDGSIHSMTKKNVKHRYRRRYNKYYKFVFVRNPFERVYSCYENKYHDSSKWEEQKKPFKYYLFGYMREDNGFEEFVRKVAKVPDCLANKHFKSQFRSVFRRNKKRVDFIGRFENLSADFDVIQKKFGFSSLSHLNQSKNTKWKDFYTLELAELVHERYKRDFELFDYEKDYEEFCRYLRKKEKENAKGS